MKKFMVIANFACQQYCEDDLHSSQWPVGTFDTIDECIKASLEDLRQVGRDHYECILDTDEFETSAEYDCAIEDKVEDYISDQWMRGIEEIENDLKVFAHAEFLSNDFCCEDTDQRQRTKYYIYELARI